MILITGSYEFYLSLVPLRLGMLAKVRKFSGVEFELAKSFKEKERASKYAANRRKEGKKARVQLISDKWRVYLHG
jgi:hypothetical protein